jgi:preprotein translocase subunit SecY
MNVGIKGVVPGEATEKHILQQLLKCKFWGGLALGSLAVVAYLFDTLCQVVADPVTYSSCICSDATQHVAGG